MSWTPLWHGEVDVWNPGWILHVCAHTHPRVWVGRGRERDRGREREENIV